MFALDSPVFGEKEAGQCKRWVRQVCEGAGVPVAYRPPTVIDAKDCAAWYREEREDVCVDNGSVPGDILFWEHGHGPHGHVAIRIPGNRVAENSTAHAPDGKPDGRGTRPLDELGPPSLIVRLWRKM